jgi:hypothetical protein
LIVAVPIIGSASTAPGCVRQLQVRVDVHRQADVAVAHQLLRRAGDDAGFAQQRGERVTQAVDVQRAAVGVGLVDAALAGLGVDSLRWPL